MATELSKYINAFGEEQARWISGELYPSLSVVDHWFLMNDAVPAKIQNWYGRRHPIAIIRSLIPGGHRLTIVKKGTVLAYEDFKLTDDGWVRQEVSNA
jgi:hypothetical protein